MALGALDYCRDLTRPIEQVRAAPQLRAPRSDRLDSETLATLPEIRRAGVAAALVKIVSRIHRPGTPLWGYRGGPAAWAAAQGQLAYYRMLEEVGECRVIETGGALAAHMAAWQESDAEARRALPVGLLLGLEGADPILDVGHAARWWEQGVRVVSLCHYGRSAYAHGTGTGTDGGLEPGAIPLLRELERLGAILDLTHSSDASARESLDAFGGAVLASHQNCRALVPGERQFPDDILLRIVQRDGVVGVSMDTWMLYAEHPKDWAAAPVDRRTVFPREAVTLQHVTDHIDHVCQLAGDARHVAIGGDTDGQGGRAGAPAEVDTVADYARLGPLLRDRGYSQADVENVFCRNWQRLFEAALPPG